MADISDVLNGMGALIGATLYPAGAVGENPSPVVNVPVLIQAGWPDSASLQKAVVAGKVLVSLFPDPTERNTTRYPEVRHENALPASTWTLVQGGQTVTVGGANSAPYSAQNLCIFANGKPYVVQPAANSTPGSVAAAFQAAIVADLAGVTVAGAVLTFPVAIRVGALRVGVVGSTTKEVGRQARQISIIIWSGTPPARDAVAKAIDPVLRDARRVILADTTVAHLTYVRTLIMDANEKESFYRRDLIFVADYGTTLTESWAQIVANQIDEQDPFTNVIATKYT